MDVLIPDVTLAAGGRLAGELARRGHEVHTCKRQGQGSACAVLDELACPLALNPVDVALCVSGPVAPWERGDGATCAAVRRVPVVLVDPLEGDPLIECAAAVVSEAEAVATVEQVAARPLAAHSAIADKVFREELERSGADARGAAVEVRRVAGALVVEMWRGPDMSRPEAERMAAHVVQAVREHDGWARAVDVFVHDGQRG
jgi:hypothetical protein